MINRKSNESDSYRVVRVPYKWGAMNWLQCGHSSVHRPTQKSVLTTVDSLEIKGCTCFSSHPPSHDQTIRKENLAINLQITRAINFLIEAPLAEWIRLTWNMENAERLAPFSVLRVLLSYNEDFVRARGLERCDHCDWFLFHSDNA
jgi:hypothetical protein